MSRTLNSRMLSVTAQVPVASTLKSSLPSQLVLRTFTVKGGCDPRYASYASASDVLSQLSRHMLPNNANSVRCDKVPVAVPESLVTLSSRRTGMARLAL